ncbi:non-homologous end joining protein Ku [Acuticoccus mangrovi]|uniref:Non-homologous end joining protein Ku n=1 Tax=Acuticoccus mangrovi TaxID=2796142 RepID=A0A934ITJ4_9HYPH|nr:Ku protein [Acuticoccus mangrovi]MBJ3777429.1 Ku protein [Acuticoccus mangrovi]
MAPRAYWKGHIRLALVSFPIRLYAAVTSTDRISLHRIHRESGERVRQQNVVPDEGPVDRDDIVMGYEYERGKYVPIEDEELDALDIESMHTVDLTHFVDLADIDPIYFDRPYFVTPDGAIATEAFVTIRDALRGAKKVALGQIVLAKRERIVAIQPCGRGLLLETLRWADEVREADTYFDDIEEVKASKDQVEMAEQLITARAGEFDPDSFVDRYQEELRALIDKKLKGKRVAAPKGGKDGGASNVVNLMDALKASLEDGSGSKKGKSARRSGASSSKASAGASGGKTASRDAKTPAKSSGGRTRQARSA